MTAKTSAEVGLADVGAAVRETFGECKRQGLALVELVTLADLCDLAGPGHPALKPVLPALEVLRAAVDKEAVAVALRSQLSARLSLIGLAIAQATARDVLELMNERGQVAVEHESVVTVLGDLHAATRRARIALLAAGTGAGDALRADNLACQSANAVVLRSQGRNQDMALVTENRRLDAVLSNINNCRSGLNAVRVELQTAANREGR